ncbi:uncharacterized protein LOC122289263 [Carya illinoinensis]|uniref:uncharacterized protein LOC122289263 n=1 Tax=Carya illinoinensis TaxID=32201 RepID=UPI001C722656|nr:uncharacterized protein LOC122289263 [Carya illinoinensis]
MEGVWREPVSGTGLVCLAAKLKKLKLVLRKWNQEVFGLVNQSIKELEAKVKLLEMRLQEGHVAELEHEYLQTKAELERWENKEEIRLSQQAKKRWLTDGDRNSKSYHAVVNKRRKASAVSRMTLPNVLESREDIHNAAVSHFQNFLTGEGPMEVLDLSSLISPVVFEEENQEIIKEPSEDEVWAALKFIPKLSSPGLDGFGSEFYLQCWPIIKWDVLEAAPDFFRGTGLPRFYSTSYIVLIPKVQDPYNFDMFRPISLCNVIYKMFSKILVNRLASVLPRMISWEQGAFVPGRSIFENITLAQEMVHALHRKTKGGNVMLKIDMAKAYDRVDWIFLSKVLRSFGFADRACGLVEKCINSPWFSIMMNGTYKGFFKPTRGLHQGDPLSPYLFIIMQEVLTRMLKDNFNQGRLAPFYILRGAPLVSHLLYADDLLIFANGGNKSVRVIIRTLEQYAQWSSQAINKEKSTLFMSKQIPYDRRCGLLNNIGFTEGSFPTIYLGVPLVTGRLNARHLEPLVNKGTHYKKPKRRWVSWSSICKPTNEGGLGIRDFNEMQRGMRMNVQVQDIVNPLVKVKDLWIGNEWDGNALRELVGENRAWEIMRSVMAGKEGSDVYIWELNKHGNFTTASAWNIIRVRRDELPWKGWFWHNMLPRRVVVCVWKAWFRSLPVDMRITDMGIALVSRCDCYASGSLEALDHVLSSGKVARAVWEKAAVMLGVRCMGFSSWRARISAWFCCAKRCFQRGILVGLLPSLITWRMWLRRCKARMEATYESPEPVWISIKFWLSQVSDNITKCSRLLESINVPIKQVVNRNIRVVKWLKPKLGWVKLNVDGSCRGNPGTCGGGGVIRDHQGIVKAAFSEFFGFGTNNAAEMRALSRGLRMCKEHGFYQVEVECDSSLLVHWVVTKACNVWYLWDFWE